MAKKEGLSPAVSKVLKGFDEDKSAHERFVEKAESRYRAFRGILERRSDAAQWTNKLHPPYIAQVLETMVASLLDPRPIWRLRANARLEPDPERLKQGARGLEILLAAQRRRTWPLVAQRNHRLQALITGLTAVKTFWAYEEREKPRWTTFEEPLYNDFGDVYATVPRLTQTDSVDVVKDDPVCEVVDMRDFIWHEAAVSLDRAKRVTHRLWMSFDELKRLEKTEDNPRGIYSNVDQLKESRDFSEELANREKDLFDSDRTKDQIELLEQWHFEKGKLRATTVGNRRVELRDRGTPFWHGHHPFIACSGMPDLFRVPGISEVELISELQEMMWTLTNQQLDNLQLLNNAIILIAGDVDDPDAFEFAPGEKWLIDRPDQVVFNRPEPITAELATNTIERLKGDLQAISGGMPWLAGDNRQANTDTATEASILTNLAQRRVAAKRQFFLEADAEVGNHFIELNDQFLTDTRYEQIVGPDGQAGWELIDPQHFRDYQFRISLDSMDESLMRQEKRAEAMAKLKTALESAQYFAALPGQPGLNVKAFMDDFLEAYGTQDLERYYSAVPQNVGMATQQQAQPGQPEQTAPQATDVNSPSNATSQSPVAMLQRMGAMAGGSNNQ